MSTYPEIRHTNDEGLCLALSPSLAIFEYMFEEGDDESDKNTFAVDTPGPLQLVKFARSCTIDGVITTQFETSVRRMNTYDENIQLDIFIMGKLKIHHLVSKEQVRV